MIGEIILITGGIIAAVSSVGGWVITIRNNGRQQGQTDERIKNLTTIVDKLPCVRSEQYMKQMGELTATVMALDKRMENLEVAVRGAMHHMGGSDG